MIEATNIWELTAVRLGADRAARITFQTAG